MGLPERRLLRRPVTISPGLSPQLRKEGARQLALPSIFSLANAPWPSVLPHPVVNLGLDLAGGSHILLEAPLMGHRRTDQSGTRGRRADQGRGMKPADAGTAS